jgi:hypothetical protein
MLCHECRLNSLFGRDTHFTRLVMWQKSPIILPGGEQFWDSIREMNSIEMPVRGTGVRLNIGRRALDNRLVKLGYRGLRREEEH